MTSRKYDLYAIEILKTNDVFFLEADGELPTYTVSPDSYNRLVAVSGVRSGKAKVMKEGEYYVVEEYWNEEPIDGQTIFAADMNGDLVITPDEANVVLYAACEAYFCR